MNWLYMVRFSTVQSFSSFIWNQNSWRIIQSDFLAYIERQGDWSPSSMISVPLVCKSRQVSHQINHSGGYCPSLTVGQTQQNFWQETHRLFFLPAVVKHVSLSLCSCRQHQRVSTCFCSPALPVCRVFAAAVYQAVIGCKTNQSPATVTDHFTFPSVCRLSGSWAVSMPSDRFFYFLNERKKNDDKR